MHSIDYDKIDAKKRCCWEVCAWLYIALYCVVGLSTLHQLPPVFIDEPWFAESSYSVVERGTFERTSFPFRYGDASFAGNIFLFLNAIPIKIIGFHLYSIRIVTFLCFTATLCLLFMLLRRLFSSSVAFSMVMLISLCPHMINMSRIARPEGMILFFGSLALYVFFLYKDDPSGPKQGLIGLLFAAPALIHPYGVAFAVIGGTLISLNMFRKKQLSLKQFCYYFSGALCPLLFFTYRLKVNMSLYSGFAAGKGTFSKGLLDKTSEFIRYYSDIYIVSSHIALLSALLLIIALSLIGMMRLRKSQKDHFQYYIFFLSAFVILAGFICFLAHYSRFYSAYMSFFGLLVLFIPVLMLPKKLSCAVTFVACAFFLYLDVAWCSYFKSVNYDAYEKKLTSVIPDGSKVLGKINYRLSFPGFNYFAAEDIIQFCNAGGRFADYIHSYGIQYIIYDYAWNSQSLKGNKDHGTPYQETIRFLDSHAELIGTIEDNYYSNRFGKPGYEHVGLPYVNLLDVTSKSDISNALYWAKIYKVCIP